MADHWEINEHGAWCINCGNLIAPSFWRDWEQKADDTEVCNECGFPDFEEGFEGP
jgi:hypothetical protein